MPKIKYSFRANKTNKEEHVDDTNQKNNWVVEKHGVEKQDFLDLRSKLFKNKGGELDLKDKEFYTFAAISYFFLTNQATHRTILVMSCALEYSGFFFNWKPEDIWTT